MLFWLKKNIYSIFFLLSRFFVFNLVTGYNNNKRHHYLKFLSYY